MSTKHAERGTIHTRRNLAEFTAHDPYNPRVDPGEIAGCTECHTLYQRRQAMVIAKMTTHNITRVPVVRDGKLVGIISRADILSRMIEPEFVTVFEGK